MLIRNLIKESETKREVWIRVDTKDPILQMTPESMGACLTTAVKRFENMILRNIETRNGELWLQFKKL